MLEKSAFKILNVIASMAIEGENLVVEKREILSLIDDEISVDALDSNMEALEVNDMIAIRYSDSNLYCVALRPKGKLVAEKNRKTEAVAASSDENGETIDINEFSAPAVQTEPFSFKKLMLICAGSSFVGGFIAAIIAFVIAKFC